MTNKVNGSELLLSFMADPRSYPHQVTSIRHIETHISHIFLTGDFAYKIKKNVKFDFLDFSTLEKRRVFCNREVELNSRFAPELYLGVLPISQSSAGLTFGAGDQIVEYVLKMKQFDDSLLFSHLIERGELSEELLLSVTEEIARFHNIAALKKDFWNIQTVSAVVRTNFRVCRNFASTLIDSEVLQKVEQLSEQILSKSEALITSRQATHVKALHGDLHLNNICLVNDKPMLFDGIEFNDEYSCCDTWADFAFFLMDLFFRRRVDLAILAMNRYLELLDDFEGLNLLNLYLSYRAAVRAKVNCLTANSEGGEDKNNAQAYLDLALKFLSPKTSMVIAIGGLSGSGKTTLSRKLSQQIGAVHIRSDAVRKHLSAISLKEKAPEKSYTPEMNIATYKGLQERALYATNAGLAIIVDAVFHSQSEREDLESFAAQNKLRFMGFWCTAPAELSRKRLEKRTNDISDATPEILEKQLQYNCGTVSWQRIDMSQPLSAALNEALGFIPLEHQFN